MIFFIYILLVLVMTVTSSFCEATVVSYISIIVPFLFFKRREYILSLVLFSAAIFYRIPPGIPIMPMLIVLYMASIIFEKRIIRNDWEVNLKGVGCLILVIFFLIYSCSSSITGSYEKLPITIIYLLLVFYSTYEKNFNIALFQRNMLFTALIWIIFITAYLIINPHIYEEGRRTLSVFHNPNVIVRGVTLMILVIFLSRLFSWDNKIPNIINNIVITLGLIAIFLTGGRTGIVAVFFTGIVIVYLSLKNKTKFINYIFLALIIGLFMIPFIIQMDIDWGRYADGFSYNAIRKDTRVYSAGILWVRAITNHPIVGIGLGNVNSSEILSYAPDADNMYIDILTQLGLTGLISLLTVIIVSLKRIRRCIKNNNALHILALPLAFIILQISHSVTETVFDELFLWYSVALTNIYINYINKNGLTSINSCS